VLTIGLTIWLTMLKRKTTHTRISKDLLTLLKKEAEGQDKTASEMLDEILLDYFEERRTVHRQSTGSPRKRSLSTGDKN